MSRSPWPDSHNSLSDDPGTIHLAELRECGEVVIQLQSILYIEGVQTADADDVLLGWNPLL